MRFDELDQTDWIRLIQSLDQVEVDWGGLDQEATYVYIYRYVDTQIERQIDRDIRKINAYGLYIQQQARQNTHSITHQMDQMDWRDRWIKWIRYIMQIRQTSDLLQMQINGQITWIRSNQIVQCSRIEYNRIYEYIMECNRIEIVYLHAAAHI